MQESGQSNVKGFHIQGDQLLDAHGKIFVLRGINHPHAWFPERLSQALGAIAATGANCVRVVMSTGAQWLVTPPHEVREIVRLCKENHLVAVLEVHDCTGYGEKAEARPLQDAVDYWLRPEIVVELKGQEAFVILNIANEPYGNNVSSDVYVGEHAKAIQRLRQGGIGHTLMVDGANWGQDWEKIMFTRAHELWESDPDKNLLFSVHMYDHFGTEEKVRAYLDGFKGRLPLVVGEFAADHGPHGDVDEYSILKWTVANGQGYMGWSWIGNASPMEGLDIASSWDGALTDWGRTLVESPDGLRTSASTASVFD